MVHEDVMVHRDSIAHEDSVVHEDGIIYGDGLVCEGPTAWRKGRPTQGDQCRTVLQSEPF